MLSIGYNHHIQQNNLWREFSDCNWSKNHRSTVYQRVVFCWCPGHYSFRLVFRRFWSQPSRQNCKDWKNVQINQVDTTNKGTQNHQGEEQVPSVHATALQDQYWASETFRISPGIFHLDSYLLLLVDHDSNFYGRRRCWWNLDGRWYRIAAPFWAVPNFILFHSSNNHHRRLRRHVDQFKLREDLLCHDHAGGCHVFFILQRVSCFHYSVLWLLECEVQGIAFAAK